MFVEGASCIQKWSLVLFSLSRESTEFTLEESSHLYLNCYVINRNRKDDKLHLLPNIPVYKNKSDVIDLIAQKIDSVNALVLTKVFE